MIEGIDNVELFLTSHGLVIEGDETENDLLEAVGYVMDSFKSGRI